jgi:hypothetical protein
MIELADAAKRYRAIEMDTALAARKHLACARSCLYVQAVVIPR